MNNKDSSVYPQQRFSTFNRTNFQIDRNLDIYPNLHNIQQQIRSDIGIISQKNSKLKEDYAINKAKLLSSKNFNGQVKRLSSMDQVQQINSNHYFINNQQTTIHTQNIANKIPPLTPFNQPPNLPQISTFNQQNRSNLSNGVSNQLQIQSLLVKIREYEQRIQIMSRNEKGYQRQISQYKQRLNKIQALLHEKESIIVKQKSVNLQLQKRLQEQIQGQRSSLKQSQSSIVCESCTQLTKKINQLTKQITDLTNQLNSKNQKIRSLQKYQKSNMNVQNQIKLLKQEHESQINKLKLIIQNYSPFQEKQYVLNTKITTITQERNSLIEQNQYLQDQLSLYQRKIKSINQQDQSISKLKQQFNEYKSKSETMIKSLSEENYKLGQEIQYYLKELQIKNQPSQISNRSQKSQQESMLIQYQKSITMLQQEIYALRQQLNNRQQITEQNSKINQQREFYQARINQLNLREQQLNHRISELENQRQYNQRNVNEFKKYNQHLAQENNKYHEKVLSLQEEINNLYSELNNFKIQNQQLKRNHLNQSQSRILEEQKLKIQINTKIILQKQYSFRISSLEREIQSVNERYSNLLVQYNQLQNNQTKNNDQQLNETRHELQCSKKMIAQLFAKIQQNSDLQSQKEQIISEKFKLHYEHIIHRQDEQIRKLYSQINHQRQTAQKLKINIQEIQRQLLIFRQYKQKFQQTYQNLVNAQQYIEKTQIRVNQLENQLNLLSIPDGSRKTQFIQENGSPKMQKNTSVYFDDVNSQSLKILQLQQDLAKQMDKNRFLQSQIQRLNTLIMQLNTESKNLNGQIQDFKRILSYLQGQKHSIQIALDHQRNKQPLTVTVVDNTLVDKLNLQIKNLNGEIQDFKNIVNHLKTQSNGFQLAIIDLRKQISFKVEQIQNLQQKLLSRQSQINNLKTSIANTKDQFSKYISTEQVLPQQSIQADEQILQKIKNYQKMLQQLSQQKNSLLNHLKQAQQYIYEFQQKNYQQIIQELHLTITRLQNEKIALLNKQRQMQRMMHQQQDHNQGNQSIDRSSEQDKQKILLYTKQIDILKQRISFLETQITRLQQINYELEQNLIKLQQQNQNQRNNSEQIEKYKILILNMEKERQSFFQEVQKMKNNLIAEKQEQFRPNSSRRISESRIKVNDFIQQNHRIMEKLKRAQGYIQDLESRCQEYLAEIQRLKNGNSRLIESRRTIRDKLEEQTPMKDLNQTNEESQRRIYQQQLRQQYQRRIHELQQIIRSHSLQIHNLVSAVEKYESRIQVLQRQKLQLDQNLDRTKGVLSTQEVKIRQISVFDNQKRQFQRLIVKLQNEKALISSQNQRLNQQIQTRKSQYSVIQNKWTEIRHNFQIIEKQNKRLQSEVKQVKQRENSKSTQHTTEQLKIKLSNKQAQIKEILQHLSQAEQFIAKNQTVFIKANQQNRVLASRVQQLQKIIIQLENANKQLILQINKPQPQVKQIVRVQTKIQTKIVEDTSKIQELTNQKNKLLVDIQNLSLQNQGYVQQIRKLGQQIKRLEQQINVFKSQNKTIHQAHALEVGKVKESSQQRILLLQREKNQLSQQLSNLQQQSKQISHYQAQILNLKRNLSTLEQANTNLNNIVNSSKSSTQTVQLLQSELNKTKNILQTRNKQLQQVSNHLKQAQSFIAANQQQFLGFAQQNKELKHKLLELQRNIVNLNNINHLLQQEIDRNNQVASKTTQNEQDKLRIALLTEQINRLNNQRQQTIIELQKAQTENNNLSLQIVQLKKVQNQFKNITAQLDTKNKQYQRVSDQLAAISNAQKSHSIQLENILAQHKTQIHKISVQKRYLQDSIAQLNSIIQKDRKNLSVFEQNFRSLQKQKSIIQAKLKQAEQFIVYLQQQQQQIQTLKTSDQGLEKQLQQKISSLENENMHLVQKLVHAQSVIVQLQASLSAQNSNKLEKSKEKEYYEQLINEINKKNLRIQQQLQQTVIRVSEEHIHLADSLKKAEEQKKQIQRKIQEYVQKDALVQKTNQTNERVLSEMRATIARISQQNKLLLDENKQIDTLKQELDNLKNQNAKLIASIQERDNQIKDIESKNNQKEHLISQLQESRSKMTDKYMILSKQNDLLNNQLLTLSQKLNEQTSSQHATSQQNYLKMSQSLNQITLSLQQKSQLINSLQQSLKNERYKVQQFQNQKSFFQQKLFEAEQYISETQKDKSQLLKKLDELKEEMDKIRLGKIEQVNQNEQENVTIQNVQNQSIEVSKIQQLNQLKINQLQQTIHNQQLTINDLRQNISNLQGEIVKSQNKIALLTAQIERLNETKLAQDQQLKNSSNIINQLKLRLQTLEKQLNDQKGINEELKNALEATIQSQSQSQINTQNLNKELDAAKQTISSLNQQLKEQNNRVLILTQQINLSNQQIQRLKNTVQNLQVDKQSIQLNGRQAFTRQLQAHKKLNNELIQKNMQNINELNLLRQKALQAADLKHRIHLIESEVKDYQKVQTKLKQAQQYIKYLYSEDEKKASEHQDEIRALKISIEEQTKKRELLESQLNQAQKSIQNLSNQKLRIQVEVIASKQQQISKLISSNKSLENQKQKSIEQLQSAKQNLQKAFSSFNQQASKLKSENFNLNNSIASLQISLNQKSSQIEQLEQVVAANQQTNQIKSLYEQQIKSNSKRIEQLLNELAQTKTINSSIESKLKQLTQKLVKSEQKKSSLQKQNTQLTTLHEHLLQQISQQHIKLQNKQQQVTNLKKTLLDKDKLAKSTQNELNVTRQKEKQLQQFRTKLFEAEKYILELQNKLSSADKQLKKSLELRNQLQSSQELQLSHLSTDLKELSQLLSQKEKELLSSNTQLLAIKNKLQTLEVKLQQQQNQLRQKNQQSIQNSHQITVLNDRLKQAEQQLLQTKVKNKDLQLRNNQLLTNLQKLNKQFNRLQQENTRLKQNQQKNQRLFEQQTEDLKLKRIEKQQEIDVLNDQINQLLNKIRNQQIDIENYKRIEQENSKQLFEQEIETLKKNLATSENYISEIQKNYNELDNKTKILQNQKNSLLIVQKQKNDAIKDLANKMNDLNVKYNQLTSQNNQLLTQNQNLINQQQQSLNNAKKVEEDPTFTKQNIQKLVNKLTTYVQENDSLDIYKQENIERDLSANPIFKQLYEAIKYKFKLLNAMDNQKSVRMNQKQRQISSLQQQIKRLQDKSKQMVHKLNEAQILQTSYQEVLARVIQMERLNLALQNQVSMLNNQLSMHKSQIQEFQNKIQNQSSSLSGQNDKNEPSQSKQLFIDQKLKQQNLRLRKQLQEAQYKLHKLSQNPIIGGNNFIDSYNASPILSPSSNKLAFTNSQTFQMFLKDCLNNIQNLQENVSSIEKDMMINRQNIERILINKLSNKSQDGNTSNQYKGKQTNKQRERLGSKRSQDSWMLDKIQQLQEKLLLNDKKLKQHQKSTENQLIGLLKDILGGGIIQNGNIENYSPQVHAANQQKAAKYLTQLEQILFKKQLQHSQQIQKYKKLLSQQNKLPAHFQQEPTKDIQDLLREINGLNNHIQIYHQEAQRRKQKYKRSIQDLMNEIQELKKQYEKNAQKSSKPEDLPVSSMIQHLSTKAKHLLQTHNIQDFDQRSDYLNDDDYIMSNNYVQYIKSNKGQNSSISELSNNKKNRSPSNNINKEFVNDLGSIAQQFQNKQSSCHINPNSPSLVLQNKILNLSNNISKDEILSKPILEYIIQNKDFDEEQIALLKKKISDLQLKSNQEKLQLIRSHHSKIAQIIQKRKLLSAGFQQNEQPKSQQQGETSIQPINIEVISTALANNLSKQQIQNIITDTLPEQLVGKIQEIIQNNNSDHNSSSSFLKQETNSLQMMQSILQIKQKYYPQPTPLSQQMYQHLIRLISSKDDQQFYSLVESLFSYLSGLQNDFLAALKQKEQLYQKHTQKMNQVLGGNHDDSQEFGQEDQQYFKRILQINKEQQKQVQRIRRQYTQKGIEQQLQQQIRNS